MTTDRVHLAGGALVDGEMPRLPDPPATSSYQLAPPILTPPPVDFAPPGPAMRGLAPMSQDMTVENMQMVHRATNAERRSNPRGPRRPWSLRILRAVVILGAVGMVAAVLVLVGIGVRDGLRGPRLPEFAEVRPGYGTAVLEYVERDADGVDTTGIVMSNESMSHVHMDVTIGNDHTEVRRTPSATYVAIDGSWEQVVEPPELTENLDLATYVAMFSDFVPDSVRPYTVVLERDDVALAGRSMTLLDLIVDDERLAAEQPGAYDEWTEFVGESEPFDGPLPVRGVSLKLWVDAQGVVWRYESHSDVATGFVEFELVQLSDDPFTVEPPAELSRSAIGRP